MGFFETLDKFHNKYKTDFFIPVEKPKICKEKTSDIKEYKRQYYLININTYTKRNKEYRQRKKLEKIKD